MYLFTYCNFVHFQFYKLLINKEVYENQIYGVYECPRNSVEDTHFIRVSTFIKLWNSKLEDCELSSTNKRRGERREVKGMSPIFILNSDKIDLNPELAIDADVESVNGGVIRLQRV